MLIRAVARQGLGVVTIAVLLLSPIAGVEAQGPAATGSVVVSIADLRGSEGMLLVQLFAAPDGFPDDPTKAQRRLRVPAAQGTQPITFDRLAPGRYAIAVCHDENDNGVCDKNIFGIPKEGVGVSNDALRRFGPPRFEDASFAIAGEGVTQTIHLHY